MHSFGVALRRARAKSKLSQDELGALLGVSGASVSAWERDQAKPTFDNLVGLHAHLRVSLDLLMLGERPAPVLAASEQTSNYTADSLRVLMASAARIPDDARIALASLLDSLAKPENSDAGTR